MRVLVVGGGGREHVLAWKIRKSPLVERILCAPGNAGTAEVAENVAIEDSDIEGLRALCKKEEIDFVVVGPEAPLAAGLADALREDGLRVFGPGQERYLRLAFANVPAERMPEVVTRLDAVART